VEPAQVNEQHPVKRRLAGQQVPGVDGELGLPTPAIPSIAEITTAPPLPVPWCRARRSWSSSVVRPVNPTRSGGSRSWVRTWVAARVSPPITRNAWRHCVTYPTSGCRACTIAMTRSVFSRRRPGLKQSTTVGLFVSSPAGRPAAVHVSLIRLVIHS
jgi:hypothetical protein